ncbi:GNAT family N-acetyltransferase [Paenibacillus urinalis]|uniref:GNAT family N-acetyltransferase n=2 Tax=Paenibacillus TaxID=44249 RepID=A0ABY7XHW2_9BACL|nr:MULTISPECIES: GNAT family N-acetyltransferase [Paenibacillus]OMC70858.1 GNAT family N-acetyltransferase [Paenibacillus sp. FSL H7-0326]WDH96110.1 GNAT family N-acetyltransferase [Paenibacillus urinalis]WDI04331.1 GNAT family N-acetyltransferase [Paenibacillus urinalis]
MSMILERLDSEKTLEQWKKAFERHKIVRADSFYEQCLHENKIGLRVTLLVYLDEQILAGCAHLKFESDYLYFRAQGIPEINDVNIFPEFRRRGIGNQLIEEFESIAAYNSYDSIGIGMGLYKDFGAAQRIYCKRGYIPDGNGLMNHNREVALGDQVEVNDDLLLYFVKELGNAAPK